MAKYVDCLGEYDAEGTTWSAIAGGAGSSPYSPKYTGRMVGLRVIVNRDAASTLTNHVQFRLSSPDFMPNSIIVGGQGGGLQTAPALMAGEAAQNDWPVDQKITAGVPITIEGRDVTADTPVTNSVILYGIFTTGS